MTKKAEYVAMDGAWLAAFQALVRQRSEDRASQQEPFILNMGECACGGKANFHFQYTGPLRSIGSNLMTESHKCLCAVCGQSFDHNHPPIVEAVEKYRDGL